MAENRGGFLVWILRLACLCAFVFAPAARAGAQTKQEDISSLRKKVDAISRKQKQILEEISELRQLLLAEKSNPAAARLPPIIRVEGETFQGSATARVGIIEYADYQCPFCGEFFRDLYPRMEQEYIRPGKVKFFYRDMPLSFHPEAMAAARAARCAGDQGKFWQMHDSLFAKQNALGEKDLVQRAVALGLNKGKFEECLSDQRYKSEIAESAAEARMLGAVGTPTFFVGVLNPKGNVLAVRRVFSGVPEYANLKSVVDQLLAPGKK